IPGHEIAVHGLHRQQRKPDRISILTQMPNRIQRVNRVVDMYGNRLGSPGPHLPDRRYGRTLGGKCDRRSRPKTVAGWHDWVIAHNLHSRIDLAIVQPKQAKEIRKRLVGYAAHENSPNYIQTWKKTDISGERRPQCAPAPARPGFLAPDQSPLP